MPISLPGRTARWRGSANTGGTQRSLGEGAESPRERESRGGEGLRQAEMFLCLAKLLLSCLHPRVTAQLTKDHSPPLSSSTAKSGALGMTAETEREKGRGGKGEG